MLSVFVDVSFSSRNSWRFGSSILLFVADAHLACLRSDSGLQSPHFNAPWSLCNNILDIFGVFYLRRRFSSTTVTSSRVAPWVVAWVLFSRSWLFCPSIRRKYYSMGPCPRQAFREFVWGCWSHFWHACDFSQLWPLPIVFVLRYQSSLDWLPWGRWPLSCDAVIKNGCHSFIFWESLRVEETTDNATAEIVSYPSMT